MVDGIYGDSHLFGRILHFGRLALEKRATLIIGLEHILQIDNHRVMHLLSNELIPAGFLEIAGRKAGGDGLRTLFRHHLH